MVTKNTLLLAVIKISCIYEHICAAWLSLERVITQLIDNYTHGLLKYGHTTSLWIFMDVSQARLNIETKEIQTSFLPLVQLYLFMLISMRKYILCF